MKTLDHYLKELKPEASEQKAEPVLLPDQLTVGTSGAIARNHALCDGPAVIAVVIAGGYPTGRGWSPQTEAYAREIAHRYNTHQKLLDSLKQLADAESESPMHKQAMAVIAQTEGRIA